MPPWVFVETSLHQQLKNHYASDESNTEVRFGGFRIDAIADDGELIEIQHASLGALRDKTRKLLSTRSKHRLRIVKPIVRRKRVTTLDPKNGKVLRSRMSPKTGEWLDLFTDLVHFVSVFPRKGLTLEVVLIDAEEFRTDRVPKRHRGKNYQSLDIRLLEVGDRIALGSVADLMERLPMHQLDCPFDTAQLALALSRPRWLAQKVAYCLREIGGITPAGKKGHSQLYSLPKKRSRRSKSAA
jgi:hypothetical protein